MLLICHDPSPSSSDTFSSNSAQNSSQLFTLSPIPVIICELARSGQNIMLISFPQRESYKILTNLRLKIHFNNYNLLNHSNSILLRNKLQNLDISVHGYDYIFHKGLIDPK